MKRLSICWIIGCLLGLVACRPEVPTQAEQGETDVFPDYREVTVPVNIAPPNFKLVDQQLQGITRLKTMNRELIIAADHGVFNLPGNGLEDPVAGRTRKTNRCDGLFSRTSK